MTFPKEFYEAVELYKKSADQQLSPEEREAARRQCEALLDFTMIEVVEKGKVQ